MWTTHGEALETQSVSGQGSKVRPAAWMVTVLLAIIVAAGCARPWGSEQPIARVNDREITEREWAEALVRKEGARQLLALIDEAIIRQEAQRLRIAATAERVRAKVDEVIAYLGSRDALDQRLNDLHITFSDFRRRCETLALLDMIVLSQIEVTREEIVDYYRQHLKEFTHGPMVRGRMIMVADKASGEAILSALKEGGDFPGLAKALSQDPATAPLGGDMGWFEKDHYAPEISKVAFALKPGQVSGVFKGPDGWYIVKVEDRRPAGKKPLSDVEEQIRTRLQQEKLLLQRAEWLRQKRKSAALVIKDQMLRRAVRALLDSAPPPAPLPGIAVPETMLIGGG